MSRTTFAGAVDAVLDLARRPGPAAVHLCNAANVADASTNDLTRSALAASDVAFCDGTPLVWLSNHHLEAASERVYGPGLMQAVMKSSVEPGLTHFLLGSSQTVLDQLTVNLLADMPYLKIVGRLAPPFETAENLVTPELIEQIRVSDADIVWVGLGAPKQDHFIYLLSPWVDATMVGVGAAFDFLAGTKRQAPHWMGHVGLEWLFRLSCEPRRLWRRYVFGNVGFMRAALAREIEFSELDLDRPRAPAQPKIRRVS